MSELNGKVLVTGQTGFTGRYVVEELNRQTFKVIDAPVDSIDLRDYTSVLDWVKSERPEYVIHLAAVSFVAHGNVSEIYETNLLGTVNLLRALDESGLPLKKVILASSANIYGNTGVECIPESQTPSPENHYGISKYAMEKAALQWKNRFPVRVVRPFNYTGVGQAPHFLIPKIVNHFRTSKKRIELGNIDVYRDFSDVRDVARWYTELLMSGSEFTTVNFCSGKLVSLRDIVITLNELAGYEIEVSVNPEFVRANEIIRLSGDSTLLDSLVSSNQERISITDTLRWMYSG